MNPGVAASAPGNRELSRHSVYKGSLSGRSFLGAEISGVRIGGFSSPEFERSQGSAPPRISII